MYMDSSTIPYIKDKGQLSEMLLYLNLNKFLSGLTLVQNFVAIPTLSVFQSWYLPNVDPPLTEVSVPLNNEISARDVKISTFRNY